MLTIKQVAERLSLSETAVRQLVDSGKIRHYRIGNQKGRIRFDESQVAEYLDSNVVDLQGDKTGRRKPTLGRRLGCLDEAFAGLKRVPRLP